MLVQAEESCAYYGNISTRFLLNNLIGMDTSCLIVHNLNFQTTMIEIILIRLEKNLTQFLHS